MATGTQENKDTKANPSTALATNGAKGALKNAVKDEGAAELAAALGLKPEQLGPVETIATGGQSKWLDLSAYQVDPHAPQNKPVQGNGKYFAGVLIGRQEIPDDRNGEENADGEKVRHYYTMRLATPAFVSLKDEEGNATKGIAEPGDIINVGERFHLRSLGELVRDGGLYALIIKPDSRVAIGGGQTMWTFNIKKVVLRAPNPQLVAKTPF